MDCPSCKHVMTNLMNSDLGVWTCKRCDLVVVWKVRK